MNDRKDMGQGTQSSGIGVADVYYILFRHKWKIIFFALCGFAAAAYIYVSKPALFTSAAKLYVRYVPDTRLPSQGGNDVITNPDSQGQNAINNEVEIITSLNLCQEVVDAIGADKILARYGGGNSRNAAAAVIKMNVTVDVPKRSNVIKIILQHKDRDLVQQILSQLVESYLKIHAKIHQGLGQSEDFLTNRVAMTKLQLTETEQKLRDAKTRAGVSELESAKRVNSDRISSLSTDILNAKADLTQHKATLEQLTKLSPLALPGTNTDTAIPMDASRDYKIVSSRLDSLYAKDQELSAQFTTNAYPLQEVRRQIAVAEQQKKQLEEKYPRLAIAPVISPIPTAGQTSRVTFDPTAESIQVEALRSRIEFLSSQLDQANAEKARIDTWEPTIVDLQKKQADLEKEYRDSSSSLQHAVFAAALEAGKLSNISRAQDPSPPYRDLGPLQKLLMMAMVGGIAGGLVLSFLIELFLDQTIKRPNEIESKLHLPLFLTIPDMTRKGFQLPGAKRNGHGRLAAPAGGDDAAGDSAGALAVAMHEPGNSQLRAFFETLRYRLLTFFESNNLKHNPKLVALMACGEGAGVTTIAAGLAASLSETGEGNVLLVDMTNGQSSAHAFYKGKPACGMDEALEQQTRDGALVQENLYVVVAGSNGEKSANGLPREFAQWVPRLKASDYDYIIFDMPPVSQISVTSKMARMMDINLLVVESEKTNRDVIKQASALLAGAKNNLGIVLNKKRTYVPNWLVQEL